MDPSGEKKQFNKRAFYSIALVLSGVLLPVSGFMNHSLQFEPMTAQRHFWMSVHNVAATIFTISAILHVWWNRRSLFHYAKRVQDTIISKEAVAAAALVIGAVWILSSHAFLAR